jgi:hypothetical protein
VWALQQGSCAYANIGKSCPSFRTEATFLLTLLSQRADAEAILENAEAELHRHQIDRLD